MLFLFSGNKNHILLDVAKIRKQEGDELWYEFCPCLFIVLFSYMKLSMHNTSFIDEGVGYL